MIKKTLVWLLSATAVISLTACSAQQTKNSDSSAQQTTTERKDNGNSASQTNTKKGDSETVYQVALLQSLTQGYYDGIIKVSELKEHGDTGIGTFEGVNGEMIVLDGEVYQALGDGTVQVADDNETIPFSNVTFFEPDITETLSDVKGMANLKENLDQVTTKNGKNMFYVVKINGTFDNMFVRSEIKQEKPYKTLDKALETDQRDSPMKTPLVPSSVCFALTTWADSTHPAGTSTLSPTIKQKAVTSWIYLSAMRRPSLIKRQNLRCA